MQEQTIGVLGCGYVGQRLLATGWHPSSWYSIHRQDPQLAYLGIPFSLDDVDSWEALPQQADCLVMTIPPSFKDRTAEAQRITLWCQWMQQNRPNLKRLIYISTIGVYAEQAGVWIEQSRCEPSSLAGWLRLDSERILADHFQSTALRCGGIYGQGRSMVEKLIAGEPIFRGNKPLHRIHVDDLVGIIVKLINRATAQDQTIASLNAVDDQPASQDEVIEWLLQQPLFNGKTPETCHFQAKRLDAVDLDPANARKVSNQSLSAALGYRLQYPSYQQGLLAHFCAA